MENLPKTLLIDVEKEVVDVLYLPLTEAGASVTMTESAMSKTIHPTAAKSQLDGAASYQELVVRTINEWRLAAAISKGAWRCVLCMFM